MRKVIIKKARKQSRLTTAHWKPNCKDLCEFTARSIKRLKCNKQPLTCTNLMSQRVASVLLFLLSGLLASFNVLVPHLLRRRQEKTRLSYPARRKSSKKLPSFHFNCSKSSLGIDQRFSFLEKVNLVPNICFYGV